MYRKKYFVNQKSIRRFPRSPARCGERGKRRQKKLLRDAHSLANLERLRQRLVGVSATRDCDPVAEPEARPGRHVVGVDLEAALLAGVHLGGALRHTVDQPGDVDRLGTSRDDDDAVVVVNRPGSSVGQLAANVAEAGLSDGRLTGRTSLGGRNARGRRREQHAEDDTECHHED